MSNVIIVPVPDDVDASVIKEIIEKEVGFYGAEPKIMIRQPIVGEFCAYCGKKLTQFMCNEKGCSDLRCVGVHPYAIAAYIIARQL
jgi:hypothetical protein